ncbi:oligoribonuclease [Porticoccaceae bacterium]|jgi:oligoribonuclease|nr:oligoribonuclease [Porticoccaceae bacterium]MDB2594551.1 oligoribonuclease [Porticoccaceae bacterium]MDB3966978.1 oligoribonuclease [Porticoccaceae bacterium]
MTAQDPLNLVWIDLEMTGLDPERERIIEIATVVTDSNLNILAEGPSLVVHQDEALLEAMDDWNTNQHGGSGLVQLVRESQITEAQACAQTIDFLRQWVPSGASPMCGNSIGQDRRFLVRYMPELADFFHYRNLDVSSLKELVRRWKPELENGFAKKGSHLALDDIYDSIAELAYYRDVFIQA